jgi:predicted enzyme related to lactoylglutathione lyase
MAAPLVYFDIAGPDLTVQADFYRAIFDWDIGPDGGFSTPVLTPMRGSLRVEDASYGPVAERVLYIGVPDITATITRIMALGGAIIFPRLVVPGVVILALFTDPAGNRMGLIETENDLPKVPA